MTVGAERLTLASAYLRPSGAGAADLVAFFPDFTPAGGFADVAAATDLDDRFARLVFIGLKPADPTLDPAERTARLYQRFLDENSWSHPGGLVARAFVDGSPFEGDELFYVAPEGRDFAARCRRPDPARKTPNTCIADFRSRRSRRRASLRGVAAVAMERAERGRARVDRGGEALARRGGGFGRQRSRSALYSRSVSPV